MSITSKPDTVRRLVYASFFVEFPAGDADFEEKYQLAFNAALKEGLCNWPDDYGSAEIAKFFETYPKPDDRRKWLLRQMFDTTYAAGIGRTSPMAVSFDLFSHWIEDMMPLTSKTIN